MTLSRRPLPDREAAKAFRRFFGHLHALDECAFGSSPGEVDDPVDRVVLSFEDCLNGTFRSIASPTRDSVLLGEPAKRVAEEHSLHSPMDDKSAPHQPG